MKPGDLIRHVRDNVLGIVLKIGPHPNQPNFTALFVQWEDAGECIEFKSNKFEIVSSS
jgi:hypothetical protein